MKIEALSEEISGKIVDLFDLLGVGAEVEMEIREGDSAAEEGELRTYLVAKVEVQDGAEFIGKHGSRLQDLTMIVNMFLPADTHNVSVILDVNNYREERSEYIRQVARRNIEHAALTATEVSLEPMLPWERRLVHMEVSERTDVESESAGVGEDRYVIIKPVSAV